MINTGFPLIYKPQWQAQHAPDFAWHCDLMKREGFEEDYEGGGDNPSILDQKILDWYTTFWLLNLDQGAFVCGRYFLSQDSMVKGVSFLSTSDNSIEGKW